MIRNHSFYIKLQRQLLRHGENLEENQYQVINMNVILLNVASGKKNPNCTGVYTLYDCVYLTLSVTSESVSRLNSSLTFEKLFRYYNLVNCCNAMMPDVSPVLNPTMTMLRSSPNMTLTE